DPLLKSAVDGVTQPMGAHLTRANSASAAWRRRCGMGCAGIVQNPAMGAEELETSIAIPMETGLAGLPNVRRIRSTSQLGVAQVTVEFEADADYYRARQLVAERVGQVTPQLPAGTDAPLVSSLTGRLNEIFELTLEAEPGVADLMALRDFAE